MAGLLKPYDAFDLVKAIKESVKVPVQLHTHYTAGLGSMTLLKAIEAGVDGVETAISPLAMGTSHTPTESLVATLQGTPYDTGLELDKLDCVVAIIKNVNSKKMGKKDIIKIDADIAIDIDVIGYVDPGTTVNVIKNCIFKVFGNVKFRQRHGEMRVIKRF